MIILNCTFSLAAPGTEISLTTEGLLPFSSNPFFL